MCDVFGNEETLSFVEYKVSSGISYGYIITQGTQEPHQLLLQVRHVEAQKVFVFRVLHPIEVNRHGNDVFLTKSFLEGFLDDRVVRIEIPVTLIGIKVFFQKL